MQMAGRRGSRRGHLTAECWAGQKDASTVEKKAGMMDLRKVSKKAGTKAAW